MPRRIRVTGLSSGTAYDEPACGMARPLADEASHIKHFGLFRRKLEQRKNILA